MGWLEEQKGELFMPLHKGQMRCGTCLVWVFCSRRGAVAARVMARYPKEHPLNLDSGQGEVQFPYLLADVRKEARLAPVALELATFRCWTAGRSSRVVRSLQGFENSQQHINRGGWKLIRFPPHFLPRGRLFNHLAGHHAEWILCTTNRQLASSFLNTLARSGLRLASEHDGDIHSPVCAAIAR